MKSGVDAVTTKLPIFRHNRLEFQRSVELFCVSLFNMHNLQVGFYPLRDYPFGYSMT